MEIKTNAEYDKLRAEEKASKICKAESHYEDIDGGRADGLIFDYAESRFTPEQWNEFYLWLFDFDDLKLGDE